MPVKSAEEVIQVGPLVLAKNAQKYTISEAKQVGPKGGLKIRSGKPIEGLKNLKETKTVFNEGGNVSMPTKTLYGINLSDLKTAIQAHGLQGYEDYGKYFFTGVSKKKKGESSSGFGPGQITVSTAEDILRRYPSSFQDKGFKNYINKFITQGNNKLNLDYNNALYTDGKRQRTTENDRKIFGPFGSGNISEEEHDKYYDKLFTLVIKDKAKISNDLNDFLINYHGAIGKDKDQKNIDYSNNVVQKLKDAGISITSVPDSTSQNYPVPEGLQGAGMQGGKTDAPIGEQYLDQPGEIQDTVWYER